MNKKTDQETDKRPLYPSPLLNASDLRESMLYFDDYINAKEVWDDLDYFDQHEQEWRSDDPSLYKERLRKRGRPKKAEKDKAKKITITLPPNIIDGLKKIYGDKIGSTQMIQKAIWEHLAIKQRQLIQTQHLKNLLSQIKKLLDMYAHTKKEEEQIKLAQTMESKVKNFLDLVKFLGLVQMIPDLKKPSESKMVDFVARSLNAEERKTYVFCQNWSVNGYGKLIG